MELLYWSCQSLVYVRRGKWSRVDLELCFSLQPLRAIIFGNRINFGLPRESDFFLEPGVTNFCRAIDVNRGDPSLIILFFLGGKFGQFINSSYYKPGQKKEAKLIVQT